MMKNRFFSLLALLLCLCNSAWGASGDVLFSQNFNSATAVAYVGSTGSTPVTHSYSTSSTLGNLVGDGTNLFTSITSSIKKGDIAINSSTGGGTNVDATGFFQVYGNGDNAVYWSIIRTANFAETAPTALKITMDIWFNNLSSGSGRGVLFAIGNGFSDGLNSTTAQTATNVHSGFGITQNNSPKFTEYNSNTEIYGTAINNSTWLSITWIINNTGDKLEYDNPTGTGTTELGNDRFDIWLKTQAGAASTYTKVSEAKAATTATQDLQNIYIGNILAKKHEFRLDNVVVTDLTPSTALATTDPVSATYVKGASPTELSITPSGGTSPYSYVWYSCDNVEKANPSQVSTSATYTPSNTSTGYYYCKVTDNASTSVESAVATITVRDPYAPTASPSAGVVASGTEVELSSADGGTIYYTTDGTSPTNESSAYSAAITVSEAQTIKAIAYVNGYPSSVASFAYTVKAASGLAYATDEVDKYEGDVAFTNALTNPNDLSVSYDSSDEEVATIDEYGEVTIVGAGETTITASFAGNNDYVAGSATYTLTIKVVPVVSSASPSTGSTINGGSTVTLSGEGTLYYQWALGSASAPTVGGGGWTEGSSATAPNTSSAAYKLYAYASDGTRTSAVTSFLYTIRKVDMVEKTWDFTTWSDATQTGVTSDATNWNNKEKGDSGLDFTSEGHIGRTNGIILSATTLTYNSTTIPETQGLQFTTSAKYGMAIMFDQESTDIGSYEYAKYIWLYSKNSKIIIPNVPAGSIISIGLESHKNKSGSSEGRGVDLSGPSGITLTSGTSKPTTYVTNTWSIPNAGTVTITPNVGGCHIYYITVNSPSYSLPLAATDADGSYWTTFSASTNTFFPSEDATVYSITGNSGNVLTLSSLADQSHSGNLSINGSTVAGLFVPANTGVLIKSDESAISYYTTSESVSALEGNMLYPGTGTTITAPTSCKYYILGYGTANTPSTLGFYYGAANGAAFQVRNGGAYLAIPDGYAPAPGYRIIEEESTTTTLYNIESSEKAVKFFENGILYIMRDGVVYDALGRVVR